MIKSLRVTFNEVAPTSLYMPDIHGKYGHKVYSYLGPPFTGKLHV